MEHRREVWSQYWKRDEDKLGALASMISKLLILSLEPEHSFPLFQTSDFDSRLSRIPAKTALGMDSVSPALLKKLPNVAKDEFVEIIRKVEGN
eukprot:5487616-Heterocapsa_arctica.AAC.1